MSNALWDWYTSVLRTRLAPGGGIIVLHTRWRLNDLIGRLLESQRTGEGEKWERKTFAALAKEDDPWGRKPGEPLHPARYGVAALESLRKALPSRDWLALYQQEPMMEEGNIFKVDDFHIYRPGTRPGKLYWHIATDLGASAKKSADPSVVWPFGVDADGHIWWAPEMMAGRFPTDVTMDQILTYAKQYEAHSIIIEGGPIWKSIEPTIHRLMREKRLAVRIINPPPVADKYHRSRTSHALMQSGMMHFPDVNKVRYEVIPEFLVFTGVNDPHDDWVDTVSWGGLCLEKMILPEAGGEATEEDVVAGSYADILRRCEIHADTTHQRRHSPPKLTGGERGKGTRYRYA